MNIQGKHYRTIWPAADGQTVFIIDQTQLPHELCMLPLHSVDAMAHAIRSMQVRGAPLIGAAAAYGLYLAVLANPQDAAIAAAYQQLLATRPTAINLQWSLQRCQAAIIKAPHTERAAIALQMANHIAAEDVQINQAIATHALDIIKAIWQQTGKPVQVLTHCNAGWLATVDWGTALSGVYAAFDAGIPIHVWVDETRPRNQGAALTTWELKSHGIPHTLIVDNCAGLLMQQRQVDLCLVGTDRATNQGDICNKIGTYLKALAAYDNHIPFYAAVPASSIDWALTHFTDIPIEQRSTAEVLTMRGKTTAGDYQTIQIAPENTPVKNYAFDITPRKYLTGIITERGCCVASREGLQQLFPEKYLLPMENTTC